MKTTIVSVCLILIVAACQESSETNRISSVDRLVGDQISLDLAEKWIGNYSSQNGSSVGREHAFSVSEAQLERLLASTPSLLGVALHHATDNVGEHHIILIPIDESQRLWTYIPGRIYLDANTDNEVSMAVAEQWANNYKNVNPDSIWFHFFGADVFNDIASTPFTVCDIVPALNDANEPQLVLLVSRANEASGGRTEAALLEAFDRALWCPNCSVK